MKGLRLRLGMVIGLSSIIVYGCHANPNDPAGQAAELKDPVRRENAISNLSRLFTKALGDAKGNLNAPSVKAISDVIAEPLTKTYLEHPEDAQNLRLILDLMYEMRDPRTLPALVKALEWRPEVSEEHAIRSAQTLAKLSVPADKKKEVVAALSQALDKVSGKRPVDNRMRIEMLRALGALGDRSATPILTKIVLRQSEDQNFLINRLAGEQLGKLADPQAVPVFIKGLFLFAPNNPAMRMNDVAADGLVRIGRPALEPLLNVLGGKDAEANQTAELYIQAVKARDAQAAAQMSVRSLTSNEATFALGQLGLREGLAPILEETRSNEPDRRLAGAVALVSLQREPQDSASIREALQRVYQASEKAQRPQLLAAMQHLLDPEMLPFILEQAKKPEDELPLIRVTALSSYSLLANRQEAAAAKQLIASEPGPEDGGFKTNFAENLPVLAAAEQCDQDVACWLKKLAEKNKLVVRKAAYMLARYGRGSEPAIAAVVNRLDEQDAQARADLLYALDFMATKGSAEAAKKIDLLEEKEQGRSVWNQTRGLAMAVQARLRTRGGS